MVRIMKLVGALALLMVLMGVPVLGQDGSPVVQVALFYSPTCPHCHEVIQNVLPDIQDKYGDSLEIYFIDVSNQQAAYMLYEACDIVSIPENYCGSVPTMVIGDTYLIGSGDIPAHMEELVDAGLEAGGLDLSNLPMLWMALTAQGEAQAAEGGSDAAGTAAPSAQTWQDRYAADPIGSNTAIGVLAALIFTIVMSAVGYAQTVSRKQLPDWLQGRGSALVTLVSLLAAVVVLSGIIFSGSGFPNILAIVSGVLIVIAFVMIMLNVGLDDTSQSHTRQVVIPLLLFAGLIVAGYLSYVETTSSEAVCGVVGDCNAVQASPYATLFGIPIGVIGIVGYAAMFGAWLFSRQNNNGMVTLGQTALFLMALFGVTFSAYLTFLEPFVIGAVCAWCITSALLMLALAWQTAPNGLRALARVESDNTAQTTSKAAATGD